MAKEKKSKQHKKGCVINLMFPVVNDSDAIAVKQQIDNAVKNIKDKRLTFQIVEA